MAKNWLPKSGDIKYQKHSSNHTTSLKEHHISKKPVLLCPRSPVRPQAIMEMKLNSRLLSSSLATLLATCDNAAQCLFFCTLVKFSWIWAFEKILQTLYLEPMKSFNLNLKTHIPMQSIFRDTAFFTNDEFYSPNILHIFL